MNHSELIELSKAAAKVAEIAAYMIIKKDTEGQATDGVWLHEDSARCFELMCRYPVQLEAEREKVRELEQKEMLRAHHYCVMRTSAEVLASRCDEQSKQLAIAQLDNYELRKALGTVCEGWTLPPVARKILESALWATPIDTAALDAYVAEKVEPWKKDAELYRKLRAMHWSDSPNTLCVTYAHAIKLGYDCPYGERLDAAIAAQEPKA